MTEIITSSPAATEAFAETIARRFTGGEIIAFKGGMGMGKTCFTRGVARGLDYEGQVTSPTFALVNEYRGKGLTLYHFDMYRIMNAEALETTGFYDYMSDSAVIACEWSENISECLPKNAVTITIEHCGGDEREITVEGDERFDAAWN